MNKRQVTVPMGILDDVKNSITGGNDSGGQFDDEKYDSSFSSGGPSSTESSDSRNLQPESGPDQMPGMNEGQQKNGMQDQGIDPSGGNMKQGGPQNQGMNSGMDQSRQNNPQPNSTSNPQAGRPEPGSSQPQVSNNTRRKMQDAGFQFDGQDQQRSNNNNRGNNVSQDRGNSMNEMSGREQRTTPVSDQQSDMEQIKAQNEQIIELLKRISHAVQDNSGSGSRRHGGRR